MITMNLPNNQREDSGNDQTIDGCGGTNVKGEITINIINIVLPSYSIF